MEELSTITLNDIPDDVLSNCVLSQVFSNDIQFVGRYETTLCKILLISRRFRDLTRKTLTTLAMRIMRSPFSEDSEEPTLNFGAYPALKQLRIMWPCEITDGDCTHLVSAMFEQIPAGLKALDIRNIPFDLPISRHFAQSIFQSLEELTIGSHFVDRLQGSFVGRQLTIEVTSSLFGGASLSIPSLRKLNMSALNGIAKVTIPVGIEELVLDNVDVVGWTSCADLRTLDLHDAGPGTATPPMPNLEKISIQANRQSSVTDCAKLVRKVISYVRELKMSHGNNRGFGSVFVPADLFDHPNAFARVEKLDIRGIFADRAITRMFALARIDNLKELTIQFAELGKLVLYTNDAIFPALEAISILRKRESEVSNSVRPRVTIDHSTLRTFTCAPASDIILERAPRLNSIFAGDGCDLVVRDPQLFPNLRSLTCPLLSALKISPHAFPSLERFKVPGLESAREKITTLLGLDLTFASPASDTTYIVIDANFHSDKITLHSRSKHLRLKLCRQDDTELQIRCEGYPKTMHIEQDLVRTGETTTELTRLSTDITILADLRALTAIRWNVMVSFPAGLINDIAATLTNLHLLSRSYSKEFGSVELPNLRKLKMTFYEFRRRTFRFVVPNLRKFSAKDHVARALQTVELIGLTHEPILHLIGPCLGFVKVTEAARAASS